MNTNKWHENTGVVPEGIGPDTVIEVQYRDGIVTAWTSQIIHNKDPDLWVLSGKSFDVIRWRFV